MIFGHQFAHPPLSLSLTLQESPVQPEQYCRDLKLAPPMQISMKDLHSSSDFYSLIVGVAMNPYVLLLAMAMDLLIALNLGRYVAIPEELSRSQRSTAIRYLAWAGAATGVVGIVGFIGYRLYAKQK